MMSKEEQENLERTIRIIHDEVYAEGYRKGYEAGLKEKEKEHGKNEKDRH